MVTMSIKAYCVNVVVSIKPIYFNKHLFSLSLYNCKEKLWSVIAKKMLIVNEIQKSLGWKKSIFRWHTGLKSMLKLLKCRWWILMQQFSIGL